MSHDTVFDRVDAADAEVLAGPHGWIQHKGSDLCMDVHCVCGELTHIDSDFVYHLRCGKCGALYAVSGNVRLVPVTAEEIGDGVDFIKVST